MGSQRASAREYQDNTLWIYLLQREFQFEYSGPNGYNMFCSLCKLLKHDYPDILELEAYEYKLLLQSDKIWELLFDRDFPKMLFFTLGIEIYEHFEVLGTFRGKYEYARKIMNYYFVTTLDKFTWPKTDQEKTKFSFGQMYFTKEITSMILGIIHVFPDNIIKIISDKNSMFCKKLAKKFPQNVYEKVRIGGNCNPELLNYIITIYKKFYSKDLTIKKHPATRE